MSSKPSNPFDLDLQKMIQGMNVPGVDMSSVVASQQRNIEALTEANKLAAEGMQAVAQRQVELLRQMMEETSKGVQEVMTAGSPQKSMSKETELAQAALAQSIANMREVAEMITRSQNEAVDVLANRMTESLDELKKQIESLKMGG